MKGQPWFLRSDQASPTRLRTEAVADVVHLDTLSQSKHGRKPILFSSGHSSRSTVSCLLHLHMSPARLLPRILPCNGCALASRLFGTEKRDRDISFTTSRKSISLCFPSLHESPLFLSSCAQVIAEDCDQVKDIFN